MGMVGDKYWRVTLIALANGAPDVMTAFVASGSGEGILFAVGSIFGAGLVITTVVLGRVIFLSKIIKVQLNSTIQLGQRSLLQ